MMKDVLARHLIKIVKWLKTGNVPNLEGVIRKVSISKINYGRLEYKRGLTIYYKGRTVLTNEGVGTISTGRDEKGRTLNTNGSHLFIQLNGTNKVTTFVKRDVFVLEVVEEKSNIDYPLSPKFYDFAVADIGKKVKFRLSKGRNALLSDSFIAKTKGISIISRSLGGYTILRRLEKAGYLKALLHKSKIKTVQKHGKYSQKN